MKPTRIALILLWLLLIGGGVGGSDHEAAVPYYRASGFNVPILEGWANQSGADFAQFALVEAQATIRTARVSAADGLAAAQSELSELLGLDIGQPVYSNKVNLADGTWQVLVFDIDDATTASVMSRRADSEHVVITFVERNPAARIVLLTTTQADDTLEDAAPEIATAVEAIAGITMNELSPAENITLPSGEWIVYASDIVTAMGMVFGNDSYMALREGEPGDFAALADAYNRTLLGFFITPDNSRYLALGLAAVFLILGTLVFSFGWRARSLRQGMELIEQLAREED